jgi:hypothetical protein
VWLVLPLTLVAQIGLKMITQELHCIQLVTLLAQPHPNQVKMIRHQAVGGTKQMGSGSGMKHQFAEACVKKDVEPSLCSVLDVNVQKTTAYPR